MKCLVSIDPETALGMKAEEESGPGYQVVSIELKDGRRSDQVLASEGCIIAVRGYNEIPFNFHEVATVKVNHKNWNFKVGTGIRRKRVGAASA